MTELFFIIMLLTAVPANAGMIGITSQKKVYEFNDETSSKDYTPNGDAAPGRIEDGDVIYNSNFAQDRYKNIFRSDLKGVTFIQCDLTNVVLPPGNSFIECIGVPNSDVVAAEPVGDIPPPSKDCP